MSAGAVFQLITNDGKNDRLIMATKLLNSRLKGVIRKQRNNKHIKCIKENAAGYMHHSSLCIRRCKKFHDHEHTTITDRNSNYIRDYTGRYVNRLSKLHPLDGVKDKCWQKMVKMTKRGDIEIGKQFKPNLIWFYRGERPIYRDYRALNSLSSICRKKIVPISDTTRLQFNVCRTISMTSISKNLTKLSMYYI